MADEDAALLVRAVREAGALGLKLAAGGVAKWDKVPGEPVTEADLAIDRLLEDRLRGARPAYGWLSEESADDPARFACDRTFLVDPIDGTRDFARGRAGWAISAAIVEHGEPVAGVLYAPGLGDLYVAARGRGAARNDYPLRVGSRHRLDGARIPVDPSALRWKHWPEPWPARAVAKPNSIALRIAMIAANEADAVLSGRPSREVDIAAAALILTEAGGHITDHEGSPPRFNKRHPREKSLVAAATPELLEAVRARLAAGIANAKTAREISKAANRRA